MGMVKLKNGSEENEDLVSELMRSFKGLLKTDPEVVFDLIMKCRNRKYKFYGTSAKKLRARLLIQNDGQIHASIKNIVLSAFPGEGFQVEIVNPIIKNRPQSS